MIRKIGENAHIGSGTVKVNKALSKVNASRNYALRRAEEVLKADARTSGKTIKIEWSKPRGVKVNDMVAFSQDDVELTGKYVDPCPALHL